MRNRMALAAMLVLAVACGGKEAGVHRGAVGRGAEYGGVEVRILRAGDGRSVEAGDVLTVHTTGGCTTRRRRKRGEKFWSSLDSGEKLTFTLGAGQMIRGWDQGLPGMLVGEVRELTIPPDSVTAPRARPDSTGLDTRVRGRAVRRRVAGRRRRRAGGLSTGASEAHSGHSNSSSMRRLRSRPEDVPLSATGCRAPAPAVSNPLPGRCRASREILPPPPHAVRSAPGCRRRCPARPYVR